MTDDAAGQGPVLSEGLGTAVQRQQYAGGTLAQAAETYIDAVDACAMARALLAGLPPNSEHRPLAWDRLQQAEETESDVRRALQRAVYYWRKYGA